LEPDSNATAGEDADRKKTAFKKKKSETLHLILAI